LIEQCLHHGVLRLLGLLAAMMHDAGFGVHENVECRGAQFALVDVSSLRHKKLHGRLYARRPVGFDPPQRLASAWASLGLNGLSLLGSCGNLERSARLIAVALLGQPRGPT